MLTFNPFDDISERLSRIENAIKAISEHDISHSKNKKFYSPKEFSDLTGIRYSTVIYRCKLGLLKARQDTPGSLWQIDADELRRYAKEANDNA